MAGSFAFNTAGSPATPSGGKNKGFMFSQGPSTTPAGPPPTYLTNVSTTPAGEPPRSSKIFGSSFNPSANTFGHRTTPGRRGEATFRVPSSSPPQPGDVSMGGDFIASTIEGSPQRGLKRSRDGRVRDSEGSEMADIARAYVRDNGPAHSLEEADDVILGTEHFLSEMDSTLHHPGRTIASRDEVITDTAASLDRLWMQHCDNKTLPGAIGPEFDESFTKAAYISTLLLQLHYPHTTKAVQPAKAIPGRPPKPTPTSIPLPRALLDWLNQHHNPLPDDFNDVHAYRPSPAAHEAFWDILGADMIRGRFVRVVRLLRDARWQNAATAAVDYGDDDQQGYEGQQLSNTRDVVERCIHVLESCPAVTEDNWNVPGPEWSVFRQRVRHAIRELELVATSRDDDLPPSRSMFGSSTASMATATARAESKVPPTIYQNLRAIYGVLLGGNGILDYAQDWVEASVLLTVWWDGENSNADLSASVADLAVSKSAMRKSGRSGGAIREVDVAPVTAYRRRLGDMFRIVPGEIDEPTFQPDSLDPVHVALAAVFEDYVTETIGIIRSWSQTLASAVVELAAVGNWLPITKGQANSRGLLGRGFSTDDLMVLSHGPGNQDILQGRESIDRDDVLSSYADLLAAKDRLQSSDGNVEREGWEIAVSVLGRLNDGNSAQDRMRSLLTAMELRDEKRVDKFLAICSGMGFAELGRTIAEQYADSLAAESPVPYGAALVYYARAHATAKLRDTISLLISLSLLHSAAMPPEQNLDQRLASLLSRERQATIALARVDPAAAELLVSHLSGYAMLRHFYSIRDQENSSLSHLREAAKTLLSIINSASDCIKGGLFDPEIQSVVPVDGILALLGEVLPLLGRTSPTSGKPQRTLETKQLIRLMAVVEDYEQISGRIHDGAEGLLHASMNCLRGDHGASRSGTLGKSTSGLSASGLSSGSGGWEQLAESSWSLLEVSSSEEKGRTRSKKNQVKMIEIERGWDWRVGLDGMGMAGEVGSQEVVLLLRTALAREVGIAWGAGWH